MALIFPEFLSTKTYEAKRVRRAVRASGVMQEGIVERGHFAVTQRGSGANMSVDVAAGEAWVKGDSAADQGYYHIVNDATINTAITANASGKPRIDLVYVQIGDSADIGGSDTPVLAVAAGTATTSATLANLLGAPALPTNAIPLAYVLVATGATEIKNASIGYLKNPHGYAADFSIAKAEPYAVEGAPPPYAHGRPLAWVPSVKASFSGSSLRNPNEEAGTSLTTESWDTEEMHPASDSAIYCKAPGIYTISGVVRWDGSYVGTTAVIWINGGNQGSFTAGGPSGANISMAITDQVRLGYNDAVEIRGAQGTAAQHALVYVMAAMTWQGV